MTESSPTIAASAAQVQQIPIEQLFPSEDNPRKTIDAAFLAQLADSIEQLGVQVPLLVRPGWSPVEGPQQYEIIAGHRRYFATTKLLKLETLPCIVREMSDDEAREIMLVENLQREDLSALEEAEAYDKLRATLGTAEAIAAKVGKPIEYVTRRLKLLTLIPFSREALAEKLITIDHALLLSKLAAAEQETALRFTLLRSATRKDTTADIVSRSVKKRDEKRAYGYWEPQSVLELKRFIEDEIKLELARAPWDLADASLVASTGPCTGCPKNTAANTALFGDLAVEDARCTDSACFAAKRAAFVARQLDAVKAAGKDAVRVSWKTTTSKPRALDDAAKYLGQVFKYGQWLDAKKGSCAFVRTGVTVDFDEPTYGLPDPKRKPGMQVLACVEPDCKVHKKAWKQAATREPGLRNENSADARAEREKRAEAVKAENAIRAGLITKALEGVTKLSGDLLRAVVQLALPAWIDDDIDELFPRRKDALRKAKVDSPQFARAAASLLFFNGRETAFASEWQKPEFGRTEFLDALKLLGFDGNSAWANAPSSATAKAPAKAKTKASPALKQKAAAKKPAKQAAKKGGKR